MNGDKLEPSGSLRLRAVQTPIISVVAELIRNNPGTISLGQGVVYYDPPPAAFDALDKDTATQGIDRLFNGLVDAG